MDLQKLADGMEMDLGTYKKFVSILIRTSKEDLDLLDAAVTAGDAEKAGELGHHIKGAALNLDLKDISALALRIEQAGKNRDISGIDETILQLKRKISELEIAVL